MVRYSRAEVVETDVVSIKHNVLPPVRRSSAATAVHFSFCSCL